MQLVRRPGFLNDTLLVIMSPLPCCCTATWRGWSRIDRLASGAADVLGCGLFRSLSAASKPHRSAQNKQPCTLDALSMNQQESALVVVALVLLFHMDQIPSQPCRLSTPASLTHSSPELIDVSLTCVSAIHFLLHVLQQVPDLPRSDACTMQLPHQIRQWCCSCNIRMQSGPHTGWTVMLREAMASSVSIGTNQTFSCLVRNDGVAVLLF